MGPEKSQNGDYALVQAQGDGPVVLAVADGVGSRPCDWRASKVACSSAVEATLDATGPLAKQIEAGIRTAHWTVGRETGRCEGMLAAIALAAWPPGADEILCAGIGDTRIYRVSPDRIEQVTQDDVETKTIRQDSRTSLPGAPSTYRRDVLTQALGGNYELEIDVKQVSFPPGAGLALVSDGAFPVGGFERKVRRLYESRSLQDALGEWFDPQSLSNEDDATLALLRRSGLTKETRQNCRRLLAASVDCRREGTAPHLMAQVLLETIERALQDGDESRVSECAGYMRRYSIRLGQGVLSGLLNRIAEHPDVGRDLFERVLELARKNW